MPITLTHRDRQPKAQPTQTAAPPDLREGYTSFEAFTLSTKQAKSLLGEDVYADLKRNRRATVRGLQCVHATSQCVVLYGSAWDVTELAVENQCTGTLGDIARRNQIAMPATSLIIKHKVAAREAAELAHLRRVLMKA